MLVSSEYCTPKVDTTLMIGLPAFWYMVKITVDLFVCSETILMKNDLLQIEKFSDPTYDIKRQVSFW